MKARRQYLVERYCFQGETDGHLFFHSCS